MLIICFWMLDLFSSILVCYFGLSWLLTSLTFLLFRVFDGPQQNLCIADLNHSGRLPGLGPQAMSTSTHGTFSSSRSIGNVRNEPDHLLVLVHGIMARYPLVKHYAC